jgi:hypothetical protein
LRGLIAVKIVMFGMLKEGVWFDSFDLVRQAHHKLLKTGPLPILGEMGKMG